MWAMALAIHFGTVAWARFLHVTGCGEFAQGSQVERVYDLPTKRSEKVEGE